MWLALTTLLACTGADSPAPPPADPLEEPSAAPLPDPEPDPAPVAVDAPVVEPPTGPIVAPSPPVAPTGPAPTPKPVEPPVAEPTPVEPPPPDPVTPAPPPPPPTTTYTLDPHQGRLFVVSHIDRSTMLSGMGHDHAIGATGWSGTVTWPNEPGAACAVDIVVPVAGLVVDPPGYRAAAGIDPDEVSESDKAKIRDNFSGSKQLDAAKFPNIEFHATSCTPSGSAMKVAGELTMHGVTRSKTVTITPTLDGSAFRAQGSFAINGSDYGMDPFTAAAGALRNLDRLEFTLDVRGSAAP